MYIYFYYWDDELLYIGSTTDYIKRQKNHINHLNSNTTKPLYKFMKERGLSFNDLFMKIRITDLENRDLLYQYEKELIYNLQPLCNDSNTKKWWIDKKEYHQEYGKEYRINNKEKNTNVQKNIAKKILKRKNHVIKNIMTKIKIK